MQVSYFVLYVSSPCLVGLAAEINKTVKTVKLKSSIASFATCLSSDRQSSGHEWTANSSLHNSRTVNLV